MKLIYGQVEKILRSCESDFPLLPPTQLYNEGWMLRLTVDWFRSLDLTSGPHPLPGQKRQVCCQSLGVWRFDFQKGQVRH